MRSVSPAEGSDASTFTVPNLGRHPHHQRVKLHVGAAKQDGWTRRGEPPSVPPGHLPPLCGGRADPDPLSPRKAGGRCRRQRGAGSDSADHSMWSAGGDAAACPCAGRGQRGRAGGQPELRGGLPLSRCATAPPRGERFPTDGNRIPLTTQCGQRGAGSDSAGHSMWSDGGRAWRCSGVARGAPPQSLRDSSPSGGAISDRWESDSADHSMWSAGGKRGGQRRSARSTRS